MVQVKTDGLPVSIYLSIYIERSVCPSHLING